MGNLNIYPGKRFVKETLSALMFLNFFFIKSFLLLKHLSFSLFFCCFIFVLYIFFALSFATILNFLFYIPFVTSIFKKNKKTMSARWQENIG